MDPYVDLAGKICQSHPRVMIYITFVELLSLMLHAKFQNHRCLVLEKIFKVFAFHSHGGHLGHVTILTILTIYIKFGSPFLQMLHMKFGFDWPSGFREDL